MRVEAKLTQTSLTHRLRELIDVTAKYQELNMLYAAGRVQDISQVEWRKKMRQRL